MISCHIMYAYSELCADSLYSFPTTGQMRYCHWSKCSYTKKARESQLCFGG